MNAVIGRPASRTKRRSTHRVRRRSSPLHDTCAAVEPRNLPAEPVSPEALRAHWRLAFDSAQSALRAGSLYLSGADLREHRDRLAAEREPTARLLQAFASDQRASTRYVHRLHSPGGARRLLRLPPDVTACVFTLDGVLTGSAAVHIAAWTEALDEFVSVWSERTHGRFAPFNPRLDYPRHIHGKPRLDGVRDFLASRGIRLPEGERDDPPGAETVHGIANQKNATLLRLLDSQSLTAFAGAREYLEIARDAGVPCAVVSASANTDTILEHAGLAELVQARVDGNTIVAEGLQARPEPDILLAACRLLDAKPRQTAVFETSTAGVAAARTARAALVVGVDQGDAGQALLSAGADLVVAGLDDFLDHRMPQGVGGRTAAVPAQLRGRVTPRADRQAR
jgi:beta-phosphoglucomutase-like phosphatase (HAD superfamily)